MYCSNCGEEQSLGANFCKSCGNSVAVADAKSSPPPLHPALWQSSQKEGVASNPDQATVAWGDALSLWWSIAWRGFIFGLIGGFILGFIGGFTAGVVGAPEYAEAWGIVGGYMASIPASMAAVKFAIPKHLNSLARYAARA